MPRMRRIAFALLVFATACASSTPPPQAATALPAPQPQVDSTLRVTLSTSVGDLTARLLPDVAPRTVAQFLKLARAGIYDGIYFYRVEQGFVAQVSVATDREDPMSNAQREVIAPIPLEAGDIRHTRGVLSLAHGDDPNSGETSFSILLGDAPHLDGKFTIFGVLEGGEETLKRIETEFDQQARNKDRRRLELLRVVTP
jgi:cyclophilin family peptidyl-prolyl cis-trans isomerase